MYESHQLPVSWETGVMVLSALVVSCYINNKLKGPGLTKRCDGGFSIVRRCWSDHVYLLNAVCVTSPVAKHHFLMCQ